MPETGTLRCSADSLSKNHHGSNKSQYLENIVTMSLFSESSLDVTNFGALLDRPPAVCSGFLQKLWTIMSKSKVSRSNKTSLFVYLFLSPTTIWFVCYDTSSALENLIDSSNFVRYSCFFCCQ